ncbi:MAG TPA: hypothetical protein VHR45_02050 [Thermoanaerobaculia bacterium]|nr:hypothetical protein [Thermoanaerobaculia bacterium]
MGTELAVRRARGTLPALLLFHLGTGARLALRVLVPAVAAAVAAGGLLGPDFLHSLALALFGAGAGIDSAVVVLLVLLGVARVAAARICRGLDGWLRHLPADGAAHRRAALLAVAAAQLPVLLGFAFLALAARGSGALRELLLGLPLRALAAAAIALPVARRGLTAPLALVAGVFAGMASGWQLAAAGALLVAADLGAGPLRYSGRPARPRPGSPRLLLPRVAWRALGARRLAAAYGGALLPIAMGWAFVAHNQLVPLYQARAALLAGAASATLLLASLGESLAVLRPAWPWARSLPWSAAQRIGGDALFLGAHALPLVAAAAVLVATSAGALLALLALLPPLAVRAAGALRRAPERRTGAAGEILVEGAFAAAFATLLPWVAGLLLLATPVLLRLAAAREQRQKVSRWLELHHLAAGDPQSWSA